MADGQPCGSGRRQPSPGAGGDVGTDLVEDLYATHAPRLRGLARALTGSGEVADDLVQETFMRLLKACRSNPGYVRGEAWPLLRTMLVRLAADRRRTAGRELRRLAGAYERPSPGIWETDLEVVEALLSLPPRMRACVVLHHGEDLPVAEVASAMGTAASTVAAQLQVARRRLRKRLAFEEAGAVTTATGRTHRG